MRALFLIGFILSSLSIFGQRDTLVFPDMQGELAPVEIKPQEAEVVWKSDSLNVADFMFRGNELILFSYQTEERWKRQEESKITLYKACQLVLTDSAFNEKSRLPLQGICKGIYDGYFNAIIVEGRNDFRMIADDLSSELLAIPVDTFQTYFAPIVDSLGDKIVFSTYNSSYPAFEYKVYDTRDSTVDVIRYLANDLVLELMNSEYKYLGPREKLEACKLEQALGIDKKIIAAYMRGFQHSTYFEPVNAPIVMLHDTLVIFDHYHNCMVKTNVEGVVIDSLSIHYHLREKQERWSGKVIQDDVTKRVYSVREKGGKHFIFEIDLQSGRALSRQMLTHRYVEEIKLHDGYVYYIYRPFESSQNRFLYREKCAEYK
ncbi:MAG: hypothetical protein ACOYLH_01480 [Flavobacteriales bacterium]